MEICSIYETATDENNKTKFQNENISKVFEIFKYNIYQCIYINTVKRNVLKKSDNI